MLLELTSNDFGKCGKIPSWYWMAANSCIKFQKFRYIRILMYTNRNPFYSLSEKLKAPDQIYGVFRTLISTMYFLKHILHTVLLHTECKIFLWNIYVVGFVKNAGGNGLWWYSEIILHMSIINLESMIRGPNLNDNWLLVFSLFEPMKRGPFTYF